MAASKLSMCLDPITRPPTDVTFLFKDEGGSVKEIKAHKVILAIPSDVFYREFYGSMKEKEDTIDITDASHDVFQAMIEFIYNKQHNWKDFALSFLASLYYLAEKYNIKDLKDEIMASIPEHEVSLENVLDIAILAEDSILHKPVSDALYEAAATFLRNEFKNKLDQAIEFLFETEANEVHALVIFKIMARMKNVEPAISNCENCQQIPCLNGKRITCENFKAGAVVINIGSLKIYELIGVPSALFFSGRSLSNVSEISIRLLTPDYLYKCV
eukprot:GFUD01020486.1.p1 GENE.GFUD01020486.1~~GFUD01020486.1.p1  ORF type:complete len:272 (+),score=62.46 GFUD01020486.1:53-868(+)